MGNREQLFSHTPSHASKSSFKIFWEGGIRHGAVQSEILNQRRLLCYPNVYFPSWGGVGEGNRPLLPRAQESSHPMNLLGIYLKPNPNIPCGVSKVEAKCLK